MKAVVKTKPDKGFELLEVPLPQIKKNQLLVKVKYASICGTDLHIYHWNEWSQNRIKPPITIGHEFVGEVVEVGSEVKNFNVNDIICAETHISCGYCYECHNDLAHICRNLKILGIDINGTFAEYVAIPQKVAWKVSKNIPLEIASFLEPVGNAVHTAFAFPIEARIVLITGCGPIGLASIPIAKKCGAALVIATDINNYRLNLAKELGADLTINVKERDMVKEILEFTDNEGVDVLLEMSGANKALQDSLKVLKNGAKIALLGLFDKPFELDLPAIIEKELEIKGIHGRKIFSTWYQVNNLLKYNLVDLSPIVTHKFELKDFDNAFKLMDTGNCGKILLKP